MKKSGIKKMPEYFDRYINLVEDIDVVEAFDKYGEKYLGAEKEKLTKLGDKVYEPGKWTAKEIIQHIIDAERVFTYRALRFARKDKTVLPSFDENYLAKNSDANRRSIADLLDEFNAVRNSSIKLYKSFTDEMMEQEGFVFGKDISVIAIGFTLAGHVIHHVKVLNERYYKLI